MIYTSTRNHLAAFGIALAIGLIYSSHHFFVPYVLPQNVSYHPLTAASYLDEGTFYGLRANAVYHGDWRAGDISLAENLDAPAILSIVNPFILGGLGILAGSFERGIILSDFIFPVLIFLLVYALAYALTGKKKLSLLSALIFIFAPKIGLGIPPVSGVHIQEFMRLVFPFFSPDSPLHFTDFEEPKITFPFVAAFLLLAVQACKRNTRIWYASAGIAFGLLFYTYLYDWASMLVAMLVLAGLYRWSAEDKERSRGVLMIIGVGFAVSSFHWLNMWQAFSLPQIDELAARTGREISHAIRFASVWKTYVRNIVLIAGLAWVMRRSASTMRPALYLLIALASTYFFTVNAQVLIGFNIQPDHWYRTQYIVVTLIWLVFISYGLDRIRMRWSPRGIAAWCVATSFIIGYILTAHGYGQYLYSAMAAEQFTISREREEAFAWLNAKTPPHSVVATLSSDTNRALLLHTHNRIFIPNGLNTIASDREIWDRLFQAAMMLDLDANEFDRMIRGNDSAYYLFSGQFTDHSFGSGWLRAFPEALIEEKIRAYASYEASDTGVSPYLLDYVLVDAHAKLLGAKERALTGRFEKVYDNSAITVYKRL